MNYTRGHPREHSGLTRIKPPAPGELAAVVLGIVALVGVHLLTLSMVAFLATGAALTVSGLAISTKMLEMVRQLSRSAAAAR